MKKFRLFPLVLLLCLLFSASAPAALALDDPDIPARAAVLVDLNSGAVLYEQNKDEQRAPASLTKVMTVLLALEALDRGEISLDTVITAQEDCRYLLQDDSSTSGIMPGTQVSFQELLYCAMLQSANEACNIIGEQLAGSISAWVDRMNQRAQELGCVNTHFSTTNGLPPAEGEQHYSSAYDLYLITKEALKYPLFLEIACTESYQPQFSGVNNGELIRNSNALMYPTEYYGGDRYVYEYAAGVKTGFTQAAGYCLISTAEKDGIHLLAVVMGCDGWMNAGLDEYKNFEASKSLYEWAFDNFSYQLVLSTGQLIQEEEVQFAKGGDKAALRPAEDMTALLPNDIDMSTIQTQVSVYEDKLVAPIEAGDVLGQARVIIDGKDYGSVRLVSAGSIELARGQYIMQRLGAVFQNKWVVTVIIVLLVFLALYMALVIRYRRLRRKHLRERRLAEKRRREREMYRELDDTGDFRDDYRDWK